MKTVKKSLAVLILLAIFLSSLAFSSSEPFSINKNQENLGDSRSILDLLISTNRLELKDRIELLIYNSSIRNSSLKIIANLTWKFQQTSKLFDYQFFNTEIFYGINGEVFPKYSICKLYDLKEVQIDKPEESEIIFLILPIKQEIETNRVHFFQRKFSVCDNYKNFELFSSKFQKDDINIIDLYSTFSSEDKQFYEFGDTHWNDFGVKKTFIELLEITHNESNIRLLKKGKLKENNLVLKRLGLIDQIFYQDEYEINYKADDKKPVLIVHDSFFEEAYVSETFLSEYYDFALLNWGEIINMQQYEIQNIMTKYDFVIFQSSVDSFFEERISIFNKS